MKSLLPILSLGLFAPAMLAIAQESVQESPAADANNPPSAQQTPPRIPAIIRLSQDFRYIPNADIKHTDSEIRQMDAQTDIAYIQPGVENTYGIMGLYQYIYNNGSLFGKLHIDRVAAAGLFSHRFSDKWSSQIIFGSTWAADDNTALSHGQYFYGTLLATYTVSPTLNLGFGLAYYDVIDRHDNFFPVLRIEWKITDELRLSSERVIGLVWEPKDAQGFTFGIGGSFTYEQYAITEDLTMLQRYWYTEASVGYRFNEHWKASVFVQYLFDRELEYRHGGHRVGKDDIDNAPAFGAVIECKF